MSTEQKCLHERQFHAAAADRIRKGDANPSRRGINLKDIMGEDIYREYQDIDANAVSDDDLFE